MDMGGGGGTGAPRQGGVGVVGAAGGEADAGEEGLDGVVDLTLEGTEPLCIPSGGGWGWLTCMGRVVIGPFTPRSRFGFAVGGDAERGGMGCWGGDVEVGTFKA